MNHRVRYILAIALISLVPFSEGLAQFRLGVYGGIQSARFAGDKPDNIKFKFKTGFGFGARFDLWLTEEVYLSFQPGYYQNGTLITEKVTVPGPIFIFNRTFKNEFNVTNQFVTIPAVINVQMTRHLYATTGLAFDYLLSSELSEGESKYDLGSQLVEAQLSALFGFGLDFSINKTLLGVQFDYSQGLTRLTAEKDENEQEIPRIRTSKYRLTLFLDTATGK